MNRHMKIIACAVALATLPSCGSSAPPRSGPGGRSQSPETVAKNAPFAVAGVKLMMTPEQVAEALQASGYKESGGLHAGWTGDSFEDLVDVRVTNRTSAHPRHVPTHQEWKMGQETVSVDYSPFPGASKVVGVDWKTEDGSPSESEIRGTLEKRYGPGWRLKPFLPMQWCSPKPCSPTSATLTAQPRGIILTPPNVLGQPEGLNRRMDAAVAARSGGSKGAF